MKSFQQLQREQNSAGLIVRNLWKKMKEADVAEVQETINEASRAAREERSRERA
jgi:hypothetical protein